MRYRLDFHSTPAQRMMQYGFCSNFVANQASTAAQAPYPVRDRLSLFMVPFEVEFGTLVVEDDSLNVPFT